MDGNLNTSSRNPVLPVAADVWRSPEELAATPEFREMIAREFPDDAETWTDPVTRRQFISLLGASMALAGLAGCSPRPASQRKIVPYTKHPEGMTPGIPMEFATAALLGGVATGIVVKSREGRPIKVEGNPTHPGSLGGTDIFSQAAVLGLYDPDRSQSLTYLGASRTWEDFSSTLRIVLDKHKQNQGAGIRILTETITSPTLAEQLTNLVGKGGRFEQASWVQYEPATRDNVRLGSYQAFGSYNTTIYDYTKADIVLALDADFLTNGPGAVRYARDFISRRRVRHNHEDGGTPEQMNRLYAVEPMLTSTGAIADHRLPLKSSEVESFARTLASALKVAGAPSAGSLDDAAKAWIDPLAKDLDKSRGKCIVVAGDHQPASVHALVHAINAALGNVGKTVMYIKSIEARPENEIERFSKLVEDMNAKKVELLLILGGNPVYNAPVDLDFAAALEKVPLRIHLGQYQDETASRCHWHIPESHLFESWGDARGYDGTVTIMQPLIAPMYGGRSALELIAALGFHDQPDQKDGSDDKKGKNDDKKDKEDDKKDAAVSQKDVSDYSGLGIIRAYWKKWSDGQKTKNGLDFDHFWHNSLRDGVVAGTSRAAADKTNLTANWAGKDSIKSGATEGNEICFRTDPNIHDGRFANNAWLQELPKPVSKLCWENAAIMSEATAKKLGLSASPRWTAGERGRMEVQYVEITLNGRKVKAAAWPQPGHVDDSVTIYLGYGRDRSGRVGSGAGFNAFSLRASNALWTASGLEIKKIDENTFLACTQAHHSMEDRKPVRRLSIDDYGDKKKLENAMAPAVASDHYDLIKQNVPGPNERVELERHPETHKHDDHQHDEHPHEHDKRMQPLTLYPDTNKDAQHRRWAMAIDLTSCIGCNVCMIACQAENNIPVVGKTEVTRGREMYWIRVDRYHEGDPNDSEGLKTYFQPVPCQQCEKAPCELVCPVGATTHSADGLNDMVYNRCVGTRYCSNNCPYKVRRFNFFSYADYVTESLKLGRNPEVTVRSRGVMEKCTYCVQRIRLGEIEAEREHRPINDGDVRTACQQACPTGAIVFGDLADTTSVVRRWKDEQTNYGLLAELNTMPRTSYLAAVRNPNPAMPKRSLT